MKNQEMMKMEIKGIVKYISPKTFGVKLENREEWYNPANGVLVDLSLKGKKVTMDMIDAQTFKSIQADKIEGPSAKITTFNAIDRRELLIIRQVAAKCAAEIANTASEFKDIAEMVEAWILR
jgi:translation initiation factor IF-3